MIWRFASLLAGLAWAASPAAARADGKRDLADGIAFYENLDTDRAIDRFQSALRSDELGAADRALAYAYLGIVYFETGHDEEARQAWISGFELHPSAPLPPGTQAKTAAAMEAARRVAMQPKPSVPAPPPKTDVLKVAPGAPAPAPAPAPALVPPPAAAEPDEGGIPTWLIWAGIGVAVVAGGVATAVAVAGGGGECEGAGGCAVLVVR